MKYWLMKSEPDECSIDDALGAPGRITPWTGVRNYQARNFMLKDMKVGDGVLFYHSSCPEPGIAGLAEVASALSRQDAVRPEERLLRPAGEARQAALVQCRCARAEEGPAHSAHGAARGQTAQEHGHAAAGQSPVDHAGDRSAMEVHHHQARLKNDTFLRALACQPT